MRTNSLNIVFYNDAAKYAALFDFSLFLYFNYTFKIILNYLIVITNILI